MANPDNVAKTILQTLYLSRVIPHNFLTNPFPYFQNNSTPIFELVGGQYIAPGTWVNLTDGQMHHLRLTDDGKLMVDATVNVVPGGYTSHEYVELNANNVDTVINFGFNAQEISIFNDGLFTINYEFGAVPVAGTSPALYAGEAFVDNFVSANVHIITLGAGDISAVRVWARG